MLGNNFALLEPRGTLGDAGRTPIVSTRHVAGTRHNRVANDSSLPKRQTDASRLLVSAEGYLNSANWGEALREAESALRDFRDLGDVDSCADSVQIIVSAKRLEAYFATDESKLIHGAESIVLEELQKARSAGARRAEAQLKLSLSEIYAGGGNLPARPLATASRGGRSARDKALEFALEAYEVFDRLGEKFLAATAKVELAIIYSSSNRPKAVVQAATEALGIFEKLGDRHGMGRALHALALSHVMTNDLGAACDKGKEALAHFREADDKRSQSFILETLSAWYIKQGKAQKALALSQEALRLRRETNSPALEEARALLLVVEALAAVNRARIGLKAAEEGLARFKEAKDERGLVYGLLVLSIAQLRRDHPELALSAADEAVDIARDLGDKWLEISIHHTLAEINLKLDNRQDALESAEEAAILAQELNDVEEEGDAERLLISIRLRGPLHRQTLQKALHASKQARELYRKSGSRIGEATALVHWASVLGLDPESADEMLVRAQEAKEIFEEEESLEGQSAALRLIADARATKNNLEEAASACRERRQLWQDLGVRKEEGEAMSQLARILLAGNDLTASERQATEAKLIFHSIGDKTAECYAAVLLVQANLKQMMDQQQGETQEALKTPAYRTNCEKAMRAANDALTLCRHLGNKPLRGGALFWRAQVLGFRGRLEEAVRVAAEAEQCFDGAGAGGGVVQCKVLAADCLLGLGKFEDAKQVANAAYTRGSRGGDKQAADAAKECLDRIEKAEKKSKELPVIQQAAITQADVSTKPTEVAAAGPAAATVATPAPQGLDPVLATKRLMSIVKDVIAADDDLTADSPLMESGMDSLSSVQLTTEVSKEFQMTLSPSLVFDFPTVAAMVSHLVEESKG